MDPSLTAFKTQQTGAGRDGRCGEQVLMGSRTVPLTGARADRRGLRWGAGYAQSAPSAQLLHARTRPDSRVKPRQEASAAPRGSLSGISRGHQSTEATPVPPPSPLSASAARLADFRAQGAAAPHTTPPDAPRGPESPRGHSTVACARTRAGRPRARRRESHGDASAASETGVAGSALPGAGRPAGLLQRGAPRGSFPERARGGQRWGRVSARGLQGLRDRRTFPST